jgi:hypothetical protein
MPIRSMARTVPPSVRCPAYSHSSTVTAVRMFGSIESCGSPSIDEPIRTRSSTRPETEFSPDDGMGLMPWTQIAHHSPFPGAFFGSCVATGESNRPSEAECDDTLSNRSSTAAESKAMSAA